MLKYLFAVITSLSLGSSIVAHAALVTFDFTTSIEVAPFPFASTLVGKPLHWHLAYDNDAANQSATKNLGVYFPTGSITVTGQDFFAFAPLNLFLTEAGFQPAVDIWEVQANFPTGAITGTKFGDLSVSGLFVQLWAPRDFLSGDTSLPGQIDTQAFTIRKQASILYAAGSYPNPVFEIDFPIGRADAASELPEPASIAVFVTGMFVAALARARRQRARSLTLCRLRRDRLRKAE